MGEARERARVGPVLDARFVSGMKRALEAPISSPEAQRQLEHAAETLKNAALFASKEDVPKLSQWLHRVWAHTLHEPSLEGPGRISRGVWGFESAHQAAVDGFMTLLRLEKARPADILAAVKKVAQPAEYRRFNQYILRLR